MCIMLVEDEDLIRMVLNDVMTDAGFDVIEAVDADAALALAETTPCPDLIVSDVNLGAGMDGCALAAALRRWWPTGAILMMSGRGVNFAGRPAAQRRRTLRIEAVCPRRIRAARHRSGRAPRWPLSSLSP